jgi:hypothetical protein
LAVTHDYLELASPTYFSDLVESMLQHIEAVKDAKGGQTNY